MKQDEFRRMTRARPYDRDAALEAAMGLFWRKGYHATSLKDLEAALSMKPGSIYAAFTSKEALFLLTLERYFERGRDAFRTKMAHAVSPLDALAGHLRDLASEDFSDAGQCACMLVKTLLNAAPEDVVIRGAAQGYLDALREDMADVFERAVTRHELPRGTDTARLARLYQADVIQLRIEAQRGVAREELAALAEDMSQRLIGLRADVFTA